MPKKPNKERKKQYEIAAQYGCVVCKVLYGVKTEAEIHHLTGAGMSLRNEDDFIPLCVNHHRGPQGVHHNTKIFEQKYGSQEKLMEIFRNDTKND